MSKIDLKIVLLGRSGVGKSCVIERFIYGSFQSNSQATIGSAYFSKRESVNGTAVQLGIWDTAGAERFESMTKIYYRGAGAAIVCYDLTDAESFGRANFWMNELKQNVRDCAVYLVGCKADLINSGEKPRAILAEDVKRFAATVGVKAVWETSAKSGAGIEDLFHRIADDWLRDHPPGLDSSLSASMQQNGSGGRTLPQGGAAVPADSSGCCW